MRNNNPIAERRNVEELEVLAGRRGDQRKRAVRLEELDEVKALIGTLNGKLEGFGPFATGRTTLTTPFGDNRFSGRDPKAELDKELLWLDGQLSWLNAELELLDDSLEALDDELVELNTVTLPGLESDLNTLNNALDNIAFSDLMGSIAASQIIANTITGFHIAANTITANEIAANAITANEIAADAVTANKIQAGAVITGKIAADAVTTNKIAAGAITTNKIGAGQVTANEIAANAITANKIAADAVTANKIAADTITANEIVANGITRSGTAGSAGVTNNSSTWTTIANFSLNVPVTSNVQGSVTFRLSQNAEDYPANVEFRVRVRGNTRVLLPRSSLVLQGLFIIRNFSFLNMPSASFVGVTLEMRNAGGSGVNSSNLTATAYLR